MPTLLLEGFANARRETAVYLRSRPEIVVSETGWYENEPLKFLAAEAAELRGQRSLRDLADLLEYVAGPHGGRGPGLYGLRFMLHGDDGVLCFGLDALDQVPDLAGRLRGAFCELPNLIGDDRELWQRGLDAYVAVHPLSDSELAAVDFFDTSGTVVSAANWIGWLWGDGEKRLQLSDYSRPLARLARLTERLKALASRDS